MLTVVSFCAWYNFKGSTAPFLLHKTSSVDKRSLLPLLADTDSSVKVDVRDIRSEQRHSFAVSDDLVSLWKIDAPAHIE